MKTIGLTKDLKVQMYLREANGLEVVLPVKDILLFKNNESYFWGGFKSFYTLAPHATKNEIDEALSSIKTEHKEFKCLVSVPFPDNRARLTNYVFDVNGIDDPEKRFDIYEKKTRNLVRKSYKNNFELKIGKRTEGFYDLYKNSLSRLGGMIKSEEWFKVLEKNLAEQIVVFSLFDNGQLVAANYCIRTEKYIFLMFNVSNPKYWEHAINDRLYDELIRWAIVNKMDYLDFGPSVAHDDSHNHFKAGFGAKKWYIIDEPQGGLIYRFRAFLGAKKHNLRLRLQ